MIMSTGPDPTHAPVAGWPTLPDERTPEQIRKFVREAGARIHPESNASSAERAWLSGVVVGLAEWLVDVLEDRLLSAENAVRATARYFDGLKAWTERGPVPDVAAIPAGSEPELDELLEEAIEAVTASLVAIGRSGPRSEPTQ